MQIRKAERKAVKIKLAITGVSGSGKTMSALLLAAGLCPDAKILVIDTEDGSSNLYADHALLSGIEFDVLEIEAPYTVQKYIKALELGQQEKYDVIVLDSISHAWAGEGGLLDKKTTMDSRGGNSFTNWATITKEQELFKSKMVHADCHLIVTMRSKQEHVIEINEKGKSAPKKVGMAPIQRDGMEYEFTTVFDLGIDHQFMVSKDRTGIFDGQFGTITKNTGQMIAKWMEGKEFKEKIKHEEKPVRDFKKDAEEKTNSYQKDAEASPIGKEKAAELIKMIERIESAKGVTDVEYEKNLERKKESMIEACIKKTKQNIESIEEMPLYVYHQFFAYLSNEIKKLKGQ